MAIDLVTPVTDFELPALRWYRTLSRSGQHFKEGVFVAEGEKVVPRLLHSPHEVVSILVSEAWFRRLEQDLSRRPERVEVFLIEKPEMERLTGRTCYQPVKAVAKVPKEPSIPSLLAECSQPRLLVGLEGLSNADNVGALVRSCVAFGVKGFLVDQSAAHPYLRRAVHAGMGTVFFVPVVAGCRLTEVIPQLQSEGVRCLAAHPATDGRSLSQISLPAELCVIFGSEGYGISQAVLERCDCAAAVPMANGVDSLNVASASAVFLYEVQRQLGAV